MTRSGAGKDSVAAKCQMMHNISWWCQIKERHAMSWKHTAAPVSKALAIVILWSNQHIQNTKVCLTTQQSSPHTQAIAAFPNWCKTRTLKCCDSSQCSPCWGLWPGSFCQFGRWFALGQCAQQCLTKWSLRSRSLAPPGLPPQKASKETRAQDRTGKNV